MRANRIEETYRRGHEHHVAGRWEKAKQCCREILAIEPAHADSLHMMGLIAHELGDDEQAADYIRAAIAQQPTAAHYHCNLGEVLRRLKRFDEARAACAASLTLGPRKIAPRTTLGNILMDEDRPQEAECCYREVVQMRPRPDAHCNLANALRRQGRLEEAAAVYRTALHGAPDMAGATENLAAVLLELGRADEAAELLMRRAALLYGPDAPLNREMTHTTAGKLAHDIEQIDYLAATERLPRPLAFAALAYRAALAALVKPAAGQSPVTLIPSQHAAVLAPIYNRLRVWDPPPALNTAAINPALDGAALEARYRATHPGIVSVDNLLSAPALQTLRTWCLDATMWSGYGFKNGYLAARMEAGFCAPLLMQIAAELRRRMPTVIGPHPLLHMWAFKYDSELSGIEAHADDAAVNVNFWLTPDDANLDPDGGGLDVWDKEAPLDWDFERFNADAAAIRRFIEESGARLHATPYRQNRAVIFNSDLFHATGRLKFKPGYENRRINVTMLFGHRGNGR
jgi:Tfp pilus assembly protein PilF